MMPPSWVGTFDQPEVSENRGSVAHATGARPPPEGRSSLAAGLDADAYLPLIRGVAAPARRAEALAEAARIPRTSPWGLSGDYRMNWLILLGDTAGALREVEALAARPTFFGVLNLWNPALDPIRAHPRFRATLERLGVPYEGTEP